MKILTKIAITINNLRVVPRLILLAFSLLLGKMFFWIKDMPKSKQEECNADIIKIAVDAGIDLDTIQSMACTVVGYVGGPTTSEAAFVTAVFALTAPMLAFYLNSGKVVEQAEDDKSKEDKD